jgi:hypothetical protein
MLLPKGKKGRAPKGYRPTAHDKTPWQFYPATHGSGATGITLGPGDRVRLTGKFSAYTGQAAGDEGRREWSVVACSCDLCALGGRLAVDEPNVGTWRHFAAANLKRVDEITSRDDAEIETTAGGASAKFNGMG